jgi:hypothetical protein
MFCQPRQVFWFEEAPMSADEYSMILVRLDGLERQVRRRRAERLLALAVLGWLLASGPVTASLRQGWQSLRLAVPRLSARAALDWSVAEIRSFLSVQPVLDPRTVLEDEREAFQESAPPTPVSPENATLANAVSNPSPGTLRRSVAAPEPAGSSVASRYHSASAAPQGPSAIRKPASTPVPSARPALTVAPSSLPSAAGANRPDLRASIRDAEKMLARNAENSAELTALVPALPAPVAGAQKSVSAVDSVPAALPPVQAASDAGSSSIIQPAAATAAAPANTPAPAAPAAVTSISLKALGYAQSTSGAQAILTDGRVLYVVNEGEEFADRFRVKGIRPDGLDIDDRVTNSTLHLAFGH